MTLIHSVLIKIAKRLIINKSYIQMININLKMKAFLFHASYPQMANI